jgi:hypothetical protein
MVQRTKILQLRCVGFINERGVFWASTEGWKTMSTAEKTPDTIESTALPAFDPSKATVQFRAAAENGAEQSKEALAKTQGGL